MKILIINSAEPKDRNFVDPIQNALAETGTIQVKEYSKIPNGCDINAFDAVVISASPKGNNSNFENRLKSFYWVKKTHIPVLGICAGHQFIGVLFGGHLIQNKEMEDGILSVEIEKEDPIFEGYNNKFKVEQHHNDSITLPDNFELLASSAKCKVQAIRHKKRPIYSVQWHAEKSTPKIIRNFIKNVKRDFKL